MISVESEEPSIEVEQVERSRSANPGRWFFRWRLRSKTELAMRLVSVHVPHGKFKAEECKFLPSVKIAAKENFVLEVAVKCDEPPETIIENAFLILLVDWRESQWRFFVRLQIRINQQGEPDTKTESITAQRVGFSGVFN